jgi:thioredoxin 1
MKTTTQVRELTESNFPAQVEEHPGLTVVDFWAPWCGPCRFIAPVIEQLADEYAGRVRFAKLNVDHAPRTAAAYGIRSIPTIGIFRDGEVVERVVGALPKPRLAAMIEKHLNGGA